MATVPVNSTPGVQTPAKSVETKAPAQKLGVSAKPAAAEETPAEIAAQTTEGMVEKGLQSSGESWKKVSQGLGGLGRVGSGVGASAAVAGLPGQVMTANKDIRDAAQTGSMEDLNRAAGSTAMAAGTGLAAVGGTIDVIDTVARHKTKKAAGAAFKKAVPGAADDVTKAAGKAAAKFAHDGATLKNTARGVAMAAGSKAKDTSTLVKGTGAASRMAAKVALKEGGEEAAKAATKAVAQSTVGTAAKSLGRFAPGVNIGIAALDTAAMASTLANDEASTGKKIASVITAGGSMLAATNIPFLSQAGAIVSGISGFTSSFF